MIMNKLAFGAFVSFGITVTILGSTMMRTTEAALDPPLMSTPEEREVSWMVGYFGATDPVVTTEGGKSAKKTKQQAHEAAPTTAPAKQWLFVQAGTTCTLAQHATTGVYTLRATIGQDMVALTERPDRLASNIATHKFVKSFGDLFASSKPNAAITFADNDGPLIGVLSQPKIVKRPKKNLLEEEDKSTTGFIIVEYAMEQSESQGAVVSIEQFLDTSGSCSIFIDSSNVQKYFTWLD